MTQPDPDHIILCSRHRDSILKSYRGDEGERGGEEKVDKVDQPSRIASFFFWSPAIVVVLNLQQ